MAAKRVSGKTLAAQAGMSQNYLAKRLRDEAPFTLDDLDALIECLEGSEAAAWEFAKEAEQRNLDAVWDAVDARQEASIIDLPAAQLARAARKPSIPVPLDDED